MSKETHESHGAVAGQVDCRVRPLTEADVFFLVGVAHGPYMNGLTDLPVALLEVAQKISAALGDVAMVQRCAEMSARLTSERAA
jgi:hypothetical protein